MKFQKLVFLIAFSISNLVLAQKIGVVDTNYILSKLTQYKDAEGRLNNQIKTWEQEVQKLQSEYETKKEAFENEKVLLVGDHLKQREQEVKDLEAKVQKLIEDKFGTNGEISKARVNLTRPFQDQIWNAIKNISEKNSLGIVLDKSNNISVLYLDKKYDYTDKILDLLIKNTTQKGK